MKAEKYQTRVKTNKVDNTSTIGDVAIDMINAPKGKEFKQVKCQESKISENLLILTGEGYSDFKIVNAQFGEYIVIGSK